MAATAHRAVAPAAPPSPGAPRSPADHVPSAPGGRPPVAGPASTRDRLLDAAARLFAERGIESVSIAEIVRAARQRNSSAVHYHFGSRDEILRAVLARHVPALAARRHELLEAARRGRPDDVRAATEAVVRPVTELAQRGWRERAYLQIGSELTGHLQRMPPGIVELMTRTAGYEAWDLLRERCPQVPADLWRIRRQLCVVFVGRAAADRSRQLEQDPPPGLSQGRYVDNLVDMVIGAMTAAPGR